MKLGITSYAYRWAVGTSDFRPANPLGVFDLIEKVSMLGLEVLQVCDNVDFDISPENCRKLRESAESNGITIELGVAGLNPPVISEYVRIAGSIGSRLLRAYPRNRDSVTRLAEKIHDFLPVLREWGITLGVENSSLCPYTCYELAEMLRQINDPLVGACIDVVNSVGILEKPLETVRVLSPHAVSLHMKDFRIERRTAGFAILGTPLGEGMVDVKSVLDIIEESNRKPNILVEPWIERKSGVEETIEDEERGLKKSIGYLRSVIRQSMRFH